MADKSLSHLTDKALEYEIEFVALGTDKPEDWDTMSDWAKSNALDWARLEAGMRDG